MNPPGSLAGTPQAILADNPPGILNGLLRAITEEKIQNKSKGIRGFPAGIPQFFLRISVHKKSGKITSTVSIEEITEKLCIRILG